MLKIVDFVFFFILSHFHFHLFSYFELKDQKLVSMI